MSGYKNRHLTINISHIDEETQHQVEQYAAKHGLKLATAAKAILEVGLETLIADKQVKPKRLHKNGHVTRIVYNGVAK